MADWERRIGAITLFVPDLRDALAFYRDALGADAQIIDDDAALLRFTNVLVFLHRAAAAPPPVPEVLQAARRGEGQFAVIVADLDAVWSELSGRGLTPISEPADRPWGMRTVTFADPAGTTWEIAEEIPEDVG